MAAKKKDVSLGDVLKKLQEWWGAIVVICSIITGGIAGWNSKASTDDLAKVSKLLEEQDRKTSDLQGSLGKIDLLHSDLVELRRRVENVSDRVSGGKRAAPAPADRQP